MRHMNRRSNKSARPAVAFSKREKQVLEQLAAGKTNREIGEVLFISESTVKFHVHAILSKLEWAAKSGSERQLQDVAGVLSVGGELDIEYLEHWIEELGLRGSWDRARGL